MLEKNIIKALKQSNISANYAETAARTRKLWSGCTQSQKQTIQEAAGVARASIHRAYKTGHISAKLVVPMAHVFNVNPDYLLGKTDKPGTCTPEVIRRFLTGLGYGNLLGEAEPKRGRGRPAAAKKAAAPVAPAKKQESAEAAPTKAAQSKAVQPKAVQPEAVQSEAACACGPDCDCDSGYDSVSTMEMQVLLQALFVRAKAGKSDAVSALTEIKELLLK